jgi:RNA polymerase sigma factor (sigma-70 family)
MNPIVDQPTSLLTDEEIVVRVLKGETNLFELLMRKYNLRLYRIGMSIVNDDAEVEDVMQTAYLNAYSHLKEFRRESKFSTWLTRILINESLMVLKKRKKQEPLVEQKDFTFHQETPLKNLMNTELKSILEKSIASLPEKYRLIFMMREVEEMSVNETMELLGLSESNVKVRLNRAKEMLRNHITSQYEFSKAYSFHLQRCDRVVHAVMQKIKEKY